MGWLPTSLLLKVWQLAKLTGTPRSPAGRLHLGGSLNTLDRARAGNEGTAVSGKARPLCLDWGQQG